MDESMAGGKQLYKSHATGKLGTCFYRVNTFIIKLFTLKYTFCKFRIYHSRLLLELSSLEGYLRVQMEAVFFSATIEEWIGTNIQPMKVKLIELKQTTENQLKINSRV